MPATAVVRRTRDGIEDELDVLWGQARSPLAHVGILQAEAQLLLLDQLMLLSQQIESLSLDLRRDIASATCRFDGCDRRFS